MSLKIVKYPDSFLKEVAEEVKTEEINENLREIISEMSKLMLEVGGVGLAATQVSIKKRFFIMYSSLDEKKPEIITIINPKILNQKDQIIDEEGCLSFPGISVKVTRSNIIKIEALNEFGKKIEIEKSGFLARCIQHEIDHLDGITFFDYLTPLKRKFLEKKYNNLIKRNLNKFS